jgi:MoxR-like ATPase
MTTFRAPVSPTPSTSSDPHATVTHAIQIREVMAELQRVIVGQERVLERVLVGLLAGGHCLLEGVPGLGKTLTVSTLARTLGGTFTRIQFTPDLLPSDIVGTRVYRQSTESFDVELGPVFANFVLTDEINRAPAKVQSALLEVMAERQISLGGVTHPLPDPFLVLATQNPIESEGVYPLPEAQRDRFLMRIPVDYPTAQDEHEIVARAGGQAVTPQAILSLDDVRTLQQAAASVYVDPAVQDYAVRLVLATRTPDEHDVPIDGLLSYGASPRASIGLVQAGQALALMRGRGHLLPQDVYDVAYDVLNHRLVLSFDAVADGVTVDDILVEVLTTVPAPRFGSSEMTTNATGPVVGARVG